jgi:putative spermidine/putrescine transport system permease protein
VEQGGRVKRQRLPGWIGLLPFLTVAFLFLIWPAYAVVLQAFQGADGGFTLDNVATATQAQYRSAFLTSGLLSLVTALLGGVLGTLLTYAVSTLERPRFLKSAMSTFSGVASQFGGVPLAFAFVASIGSAGLLTSLLAKIGIDLYGTGFSLLSFSGLVIVYLYFQIPLMLIIMTPAVEGLRRSWREAADGLGASTFQYWARVGIPLLTPAFIGGVVLLFANAFAAYATAQVLTSGSVNLVPIQIGFFVQGNVFAGQSQVGYALALGMIVVVSVALAINIVLQRRVARWAS